MKTKCRIDNHDLTEVIDFGDMYFSDFVDNAKDGFKSPLKLGICEKCGLVQLYEAPEPEKMYRKYWYRSGINDSMVRDLADIVRSCHKYVQVNSGDTVLDIAANDGTLLGFWNSGSWNSRDFKVNRIGIDPAKNLEKHRVGTYDSFVEDFFSSKNYWSVAKERAKVITSIAMFYDLPDPAWFVREVKDCLHPHGLWVLQLSYTPLMLQQNAFDNICHEHIEYYTLNVIKNLLKNNGMRIVDVELNNVNSGSIRVYATHENNWVTKLTTHDEILGEFRTDSLIEYEKKLKLDTPEPYLAFARTVETEKERTIALLKSLKSQGKLVIGYGASTKGNTLLQHYGIGPSLIPYIAERTPEKWEKVTVGTGIPIISEEEMREMKPDYLFVLPWHFTNNFMEREKELRNNGTQFIVPLPMVTIRG